MFPTGRACPALRPPLPEEQGDLDIFISEVAWRALPPALAGWLCTWVLGPARPRRALPPAPEAPRQPKQRPRRVRRPPLAPQRHIPAWSALLGRAGYELQASTAGGQLGGYPIAGPGDLGIGGPYGEARRIKGLFDYAHPATGAHVQLVVVPDPQASCQWAGSLQPAGSSGTRLAPAQDAP